MLYRKKIKRLSSWEWHIYFICLWTIGMNVIYTIGYTQVSTTKDNLEHSFSDTLSTKVYTLPEITIYGFKESWPVGDSLTKRLSLGNTLSQTISWLTPYYLRTYGSGGTATIAFRGLPAQHTQVLWEGIPINSPTLGLTDLNTLSAGKQNELYIIQNQENNTLSSTFGGSVNLYHKPLKHHNLYYKYQSDRSHVLRTDLNYRSKKFFSHAFFSLINDQNHFTYIHPNTQTREYENHAEAAISEIRLQASFNTSKTNISLQGWLQNNHNNIPGNVFSQVAQGKQKDINLRFLFQAEKYISQKQHISLKQYIGNTRSTYNTFDNNITSHVKTYSYITQFLYNHEIYPTLHITTAGNLSVDKAQTNHYTSTKYRTTINTKWSISFVPWLNLLYIKSSVNILYVNTHSSYIQPSLFINWHAIKKHYFSLLWEEVNRIPTFNDLYWAPGGNPQLTPEKGNTWQLNYTYHGIKNKSLSLNAYYTTIQNGIEWIPVENSDIWSPVNRHKIIARGLELLSTIQHIKLPYIYGELGVRGHASIQFTSYKEPRFDGDQADGKQLRYTPKYIWNIHSWWLYKKWIIHSSLKWTSRRYITDTEDINQSLEPYFIMNMVISYQLLYPLPLQLSLEIENLNDISYQHISGYPESLRKISFGLNITF